MKAENTIKAGDYFTVPLSDGRFALCQGIWNGVNSDKKKFKNIFAFCVLSVSDDKLPSDNGSYLEFEYNKKKFKVIFSALEKISSGEWQVVGSGLLEKREFKDFYFNMAGTLYCNGDPVGVLPLDEYQRYITLAVSGYALIDKFLMQY